MPWAELNPSPKTIRQSQRVSGRNGQRPSAWRTSPVWTTRLGCLETDTLGIWFDVLHVPVLSGCEPIVPIATVDELLDAVAHALEEIDSASELERIWMASVAV